MPRLHLTDLVVQRLSAIGIYYDTKNPAFGIRVGKNRKAWVITRGTYRQRITVGHYPAMSLADARKEARRLLTEPAAKHAGMRFEEAYELFEQQHIEIKKARVLPEWVTKNSKEDTFPYGQFVADILATVPRRTATDLLFPSKVSDERPLSGWSKYKKQLQDGVEGWTLHDLRRTYRSRHAEIGTPREIAERLINHVAGVTTDVEQIYDRHTYLPEMRNAVAAYESHLTFVLGQERPIPRAA